MLKASVTETGDHFGSSAMDLAYDFKTKPNINCNVYRGSCEKLYESPH